MHKVNVEPFGESFECGEDESLLDAALRARLFLRYGCKHGGCGTCKVQVVEGELDITASTYALPPAEREAGITLVCQSYPLEDCTIDVTSMNLDADEFYKGDDSRTYELEVEGVEALTHDIRRVRLRHVGETRMSFVAGQFVNVRIPGTDQERSFSMANGSADDDRIDLICKILPGGLFSGFLEAGPAPGTRLEVTGPFGMMAVRLSHRGIVMVAGGSGLAPLLSMLTDLARKGCTRPVTLYFGARTVDDLYALDEIRELGRVLPTLEFVPVVMDHDGTWEGATGLVTEAMAAHRESFAGTDAYLCGPPPMIDAATALLVARGVRPQNVRFDAFVSTGSSPVAC
jgi:propane monooxygenase reductase subunit